MTTSSYLQKSHACYSSSHYSSTKHDELESSMSYSGTTNHFLCPQAPVSHCQMSPRSVKVKVANGQHFMSNIMTHLNLKNLSKETSLAYTMPSSSDSPVSIRNSCDSGMHCTFGLTNFYA